MFRKKRLETALANVPPGKKLAIISVHDYPGTLYTAYWEIGVSNAAPYYWRAKIMSRETGLELATEGGEGASENEARLLSQEWVKAQMPNYKRAVSP